MATFLTILLILLIVNIGLLLFSTTNSRLKIGRLNKNLPDQKSAKIYPLDLNTSKYKKAI